MDLSWHEPGDGSPGPGALFSLLSALRSDVTEDELALGRQVAARAALTARAHRERPRQKMIGKALGAKALLSGITGAMALTGGVAAAATGALPPGAQHAAHDVFSSLGIRVPSGRAGQQTTNQVPQGSTRATPSTGVDKGAVISTFASGGKSQAGQHGKASSTTTTAATTPNKGSQVSNLARTTPATGVDKGAVISTFASGGKSQAGQHGKASSTTTTAATTPNKGSQVSNLARTTPATGVDKGAVISTFASGGKSQ